MAPRKVKTSLSTRYKEDTQIEVGVDEAGRGCFWGPIVAGAVIWPAEENYTEEHRLIAPQIQDSKIVSKKKRPILAEAIKRLAVGYGIGMVSSKEIDTMGMTQANQEAFVRALKAVGKKFDRVLIDGILSCNYDSGSPCEIETVIDGDARLLSIAAASILAKVAHDEYVSEWCKKNQEVAAQYDLMSCMGYGTLRHRNAIKERGLLEEHRRLFQKQTRTSCLLAED